MFDKDGYPTPETLEKIATWDVTDVDGWFGFIEDAWHFKPEYFRREGYRIYPSTGGWSGNEDIISAMMDNNVLWMFTWYSSKRGGHYEFQVKEDKP